MHHSDRKIKDTLGMKCLEACPDALFWFNAEQRVVFVNEAACEELGYSNDELIGMHISAIEPNYSADTFGIHSDLWKPLFKGKSVRFTTQHKHRDGHLIDVEISNKLIYDDGQMVAISFVRDITASIISEEKLKAINERMLRQQEQLNEKNKMLEMAMEASYDGLWFINLKNNNRILDDKWRLNVGMGNAGTSLYRWVDRIHPEDKEKIQNEFNMFLGGAAPEIEQIYRIEDIDGQYHWIRTRGKTFPDENGEPYMLAGVNSDIDNLKKQEELLQRLAYHDHLTGLPNRGFFIERVDAVIKQPIKDNEKAAILFIDVDNFKRINDSKGHGFGDEILQTIGMRMAGQIRKYDTLARLGGDEFAVFLQNLASIDEASGLSIRLKNCFLEPFGIDKSFIQLSCSIGVSIFPDDGNTVDELLKTADTAMYRAKEEGKNNIQFFNHTMKENILFKLELEKKLTFAVANDELSLYFQPQYNFKSGELRGVEALLRWQNCQMSNISPSQFIPVAEETGQIIPIGEWVLRTACAKAVAWKQMYGFNGIVSVNISIIQMKNANFVESVRRAIIETGIDPSSLELEITESVFIESFESVVGKLMELKEMGLTISLDDFGTGYSSLSYLKHLPINILKIDKSFINELKNGSVESKIVSSMIALMHDMGILTVSEGVETAEQFSFLEKAGCDFVQGYLTGRPISEEKISYLFDKLETNKIQ